MNQMFFQTAEACLINILIGLLFIFSMSFISSCNNNTGNDSPATGSVSFQIKWPADAGDNIEASQWVVKDSGSETSQTLVSATPVTLSDDCQSRGIVTVAVSVTDALETFSVSEQFACDQGVGKINISAGTGRYFIVSGLGGDGTERYHGEKQDITIHAGSNDIGVIQMERNSEFCTDADGDGYYAERDCGTAIDCNDRNADIYPGAMEICGDGRDQDCDGKDTACQPVPADVDDDGDGYSENQGDCSDRNANIFPGAVEICDSLDNDCDGSVDEGNVCQTCTDADKDGYYKENGCGGTQDCNDNDLSINPGAAEICGDSVDNDCDGLIDCDDPDCDAECIPCTDADGDGFFAEANCGSLVDCDDNDASINPNADEICGDSIDQNCDGEADENCNEKPSDNSKFYGTYSVIVDFPCDHNEVAMTFGNDQTIKEEFYFYIPLYGNSSSYSFIADDSRITYEISINNNTIVLDEIGDWLGGSEHDWTVHTIFEFSDDYNTLVLTGNSYDNGDPPECQGNITGSGTLLENPDKYSIDDFVGTWKGTGTFISEGDNFQGASVNLVITKNGNLIDGRMEMAHDGKTSTDNFSGSVINGEFQFDVPCDDPTHPDCLNWDVDGTASLSSDGTAMTFILDGIFCGRDGGDRGNFTANLIKQ